MLHYSSPGAVTTETCAVPDRWTSPWTTSGRRSKASAMADHRDPRGVAGDAGCRHRNIAVHHGGSSVTPAPVFVSAGMAGAALRKWALTLNGALAGRGFTPAMSRSAHGSPARRRSRRRPTQGSRRHRTRPLGPPHPPRARRTPHLRLIHRSIWLITFAADPAYRRPRRRAGRAGGARREHAAGALKLRLRIPPAGSPAAPANELGLRNVAFEVSDLQAAVHQAAADGYRLVGGIGEAPP